jgi:hypothetical protein
MDVLASNGEALRITVHRTGAGHVELNNLLEVAEVLRDGGLAPVGAYSVRGFLSLADDDSVTILDAESGLAIPRQWTIAVGDWLQMLAEDLTDGPDGAPSVQVHNEAYGNDPAMWASGKLSSQ